MQQLSSRRSVGIAGVEFKKSRIIRCYCLDCFEHSATWKWGNIQRDLRPADVAGGVICAKCEQPI